jgi:hypothetical protein
LVLPPVGFTPNPYVIPHDCVTKKTAKFRWPSNPHPSGEGNSGNDSCL